jgi:sporulation protein YlmC with PRC-barrel domain
MKRRSAEELLNARVSLHGIVLGRVVDLTVDLETGSVAGFEVRCGDGVHRFVPLTAVRVRDDEVEVASALLVLDDLEHYRARGRSVRALLEADVWLPDLLVDEDGRVDSGVGRPAGTGRT